MSRRSGCQQYLGMMALNSMSRLLPCAFPTLQDQGRKHLPNNRISEKPLSLKEAEDFRSTAQDETQPHVVTL